MTTTGLGEVVSRSSQYNHPGWTVIRLRGYFEQANMETAPASTMVHSVFREWCVDNVHFGSWEINGVTRFSYRIQFANSTDALAFKLRFGIP